MAPVFLLNWLIHFVHVLFKGINLTFNKTQTLRLTDNVLQILTESPYHKDNSLNKKLLTHRDQRERFLQTDNKKASDSQKIRHCLQEEKS